LKQYATCPICGYKFCKAKVCYEMELLCPKCNSEILVNLDEIKGVSSKLIKPLKQIIVK